MSSVLILLVAATMPVAEAPQSDDQPRRHHEINNDLRDAIRCEATAKTPAERGAAIRQMAAVYNELRRDPRLTTSSTLQQYKTRLWSRLLKVKKDLLREISYEEKKRARADRTAAANVHQDGRTTNGQGTDQSDDQSEALLAQLALVSYSMGGPAQFFAQSESALAGGPRDDSAALIALIERTISPGFWDVNGGPGTIIYYAPLHALVVRATSEVHGNVGGLVEGLRGAGR